MPIFGAALYTVVVVVTSHFLCLVSSVTFPFIRIFFRKPFT